MDSQKKRISVAEVLEAVAAGKLKLNDTLVVPSDSSECPETLSLPSSLGATAALDDDGDLRFAFNSMSVYVLNPDLPRLHKWIGDILDRQDADLRASEYEDYDESQ